MCESAPQGGKMFKFMRYDVRLEQDWMRENLSMELSESELARLRCMDDPATVPEIYEIGRRAAETQVKESHWTGTLAAFIPPPKGEGARPRP